jgi:hypothetical protein
MTSPLPSEVLSRAADLIEPEGAWTQGSYGRTADGSSVYYDDPNAVCFCLRGALRRVDPTGSWMEYAANHRLSAAWNDAFGRTQAEVVSALRQASQLAKSEGC